MSADTKVVSWQKRKKTGAFPNPVRSGCTMTLWSSKMIGVLFGGVTDEDIDEEGMKSVFWNDLFGYRVDGGGRWILMGLKRGRKSKQKQKQGGLGKKGGDSDVEEADDIEKSETMKSVEIEDPSDPLLTVPLTRYNAMLAVLRNTLYMCVPFPFHLPPYILCADMGEYMNTDHMSIHLTTFIHSPWTRWIDTYVLESAKDKFQSAGTKRAAAKVKVVQVTKKTRMRKALKRGVMSLETMMNWRRRSTKGKEQRRMLKRYAHLMKMFIISQESFRRRSKMELALKSNPSLFQYSNFQ